MTHSLDTGSTGSAPDLAILGGGPAGLAAAFYAQRAGLFFVLFERSAEVGGLCRTFVHGEHRYDSGAHRFHDRDPEITQDVRALLGDALQPVAAPSHVYDRGRWLEFPPSPLGWLRGHGLLEAGRVLTDVLGARWRARPERTFEDLALNRYGRRLGKPVLLDYSEKLWGLPARELAPEAATRRLSGLSLTGLLVETLMPKRRAAHLDGEFWYPRGGYGAIVESLRGALDQAPGPLREARPPTPLRLEHEVTGLTCRNRRIEAIELAGRAPAAVSGRVVSTLPLPLVVRFLGDALPASAHAAAASLRFRSVRLVFLRLAVPRCSASATLYIPDPRYAVSRVTEPKNRSAAMAPAHETALLCEIPCSVGDALWTLEDAALAARVIDELASIGLLDPATVLDCEHRTLPNAYPVYALDYKGHVATILAALAEVENLDLLGRNGLFWYSHLHDQMRAARDYVGSLVARGRRPTISLHITASASKL